jgi:outer membrane protein assembly factor BamB
MSDHRRRVTSIMPTIGFPLCLYLGCLVALLFSTVVRAGDWPQWLGPQRNGVSHESVGVWTDAPPVVWRQPVGNGFSVPVVADGTVFVHAAVPDKDEEEVSALDARTGDVLWRDSYTRATYRSELGVGPRATPSVVDGRLYTIGITGVLSCYSCASGERLWQTNPYDELKVSLPGFGVCSSPVIADGRFRSGGRVRA